MTTSFEFGGEVVWHPTTASLERSHVKQFMAQHHIDTFETLLARSQQEVAWFTAAALDYLDIQFQQPYTQVVDLSQGIQWPRWCVGGKLNIVYNCVDKWAQNPATASRPALVWEGEEGQSRTLSYSELAVEVNRCANALRQLGLGKGDAIGLHMPMTPELVVAFLAIAKIGAVILPLFSGYGVSAIVSRLQDAQAKALFTADGFFRRGQGTALKPTADEALLHLPTIQHVIVLQRAHNDIAMLPGRDHWWHELIPQQPVEAPLEITEAEDLLMIIYTSGTTGKPKGAVHTHCGFPVKAAMDMAFGMDTHPGDLFYWLTDMGWMMGPWLVFGTTLLGATCFLYDGAPDYPAPDRVWAQVARHKITDLGLSPTLIRALAAKGEQYVQAHDRSSLRIFASSGEPWNPDPWLWLFNVVGEGKCPIVNYSGGTEISGGIVIAYTTLPMKPTAFSAPCLGIAADVVDEQGQSIRNQVGELVIRQPWLGMTKGFWQNEARYLEAYWSRFDNIWVHGDWAAIDDDGMWYILGRSDDTIKVAGKRLGPAEVESILVNHPAIMEAATIGIPHDIKGNEVICFCVLKPHYTASAELVAALQAKVAQELGKPLQPKTIQFVADLPKTRNGKLMRRMIRAAYLGQDPGDTSGLVNPEAVEALKIK